MKSLKDIFKKKENINKKSSSYWPKEVRKGLAEMEFKDRHFLHEGTARDVVC